LMAWAKLLGYRDAFNLLKANEQEEKAADAKLSKLAESTINQQAVAAGSGSDDEEEEDEETTAAASRQKRRRTA